MGGTSKPPSPLSSVVCRSRLLLGVETTSKGRPPYTRIHTCTSTLARAQAPCTRTHASARARQVLRTFLVAFALERRFAPVAPTPTRLQHNSLPHSAAVDIVIITPRYYHIVIITAAFAAAASTTTTDPDPSPTTSTAAIIAPPHTPSIQPPTARQPARQPTRPSTMPERSAAIRPIAGRAGPPAPEPGGPACRARSRR